MGLYIAVTYVDVTDPERRYMLGDDPMCETGFDTVGEVFAACAGRERHYAYRAMGRCTGYVYHDVDAADHRFEPREGDTWCRHCNAARGEAPHVWAAVPIGWVFVSRQRYGDDPGYKGPDGKVGYLREAWVTVHTAPDTVVRTPHYASIGKG